MSAELLNLYCFACLLLKVFALCGFLPGLLLVIFGERVHSVGFETVSVKDSGRAVSQLSHLFPTEEIGNKPARDLRRYA